MIAADDAWSDDLGGTGLTWDRILFDRLGPEEVVGGRVVLEVVVIDRKLLAQADYGRLDFKRGIRDDRRQRRCLIATHPM